MRIYSSIFFLGCIVMGHCAGGGDETATGLPADYEQNDRIQKTLGGEHQKLAKQVGDWKVTTKYSEAFGGLEETGTCTMKLVMDGKFILSEGETPMLGTPTKTMGMFGYDTLTKEYIAINFNSMYTSAYPMTGKLRDDGVIEYLGTMKDAMSPQGRIYRAEEKHLSDDKFEIVVYDGTGEKEFHVMTMTYTRVEK